MVSASINLIALILYLCCLSIESEPLKAELGDVRAVFHQTFEDPALDSKEPSAGFLKRIDNRPCYIFDLIVTGGLIDYVTGYGNLVVDKAELDDGTPMIACQRSTSSILGFEEETLTEINRYCKEAEKAASQEGIKLRFRNARVRAFKTIESDHIYENDDGQKALKLDDLEFEPSPCGSSIVNALNGSITLQLAHTIVIDEFNISAIEGIDHPLLEYSGIKVKISRSSKDEDESNHQNSSVVFNIRSTREDVLKDVIAFDESGKHLDKVMISKSIKWKLQPGLNDNSIRFEFPEGRIKKVQFNLDQEAMKVKVLFSGENIPLPESYN